jgi:Acyl carrier protein
MDGSLEQVYETLTLVLRDVFDNDDLLATPELTARMVEGWDSLGNVRLFLEIEKTFSMRFSAMEIAALRNVGQLAERILQKKAERSI